MWSHANEVLNNAVARIVNAAADFLPGLLALLIILALTLGIAFIVRGIIRRGLKGIRFDDRLNQWGLPALADWEPFWCCASFRTCRTWPRPRSS
jgi:hypothetical protein